MTFAYDYPDQRYVVARTALNRECLLPGDMNGIVTALLSQRVDSRTIVARGQLPSEHHIVDAAAAIRLNRRDQLAQYLLVDVGDSVAEGQTLANKNLKNPNRGQRAVSPVDGMVVGVSDGRIVVRQTPEEFDLVAGMQGLVVEVIKGRGVVIQTHGAVVQGVWGNGKRAVGNLKMEPTDGMEFIEGGVINLEWRGSIVVTKRPLTHTNLIVMQTEDIAGVVAPSMDSSLLAVATAFDRAILLTEGFGNLQMSRPVQDLLENLTTQYPNVQAIVDAYTPSSNAVRRPDVMINVPIRDNENLRDLEPTARLKKGDRVRVTRSPYFGQGGVVRELPRTLLAIGNGLRVPAAEVELSGGEVLPVPIANLELFAG